MAVSEATAELATASLADGTAVSTSLAADTDSATGVSASMAEEAGAQPAADITSETFSGDGAVELESLCMSCMKNGTTRLLMTRIPHFRELVVMAFECPHCGEKNSEVQFAGQLQPHGCHYELAVAEGDAQALNRQVVKSDAATITIPELEFEIPPESQKGSLNTVEGVLRRAADELRLLQEERRKVDPETTGRIDAFLERLEGCAEGRSAFTLVLDDPAGNSFVENPNAPQPDPQLRISFYERTSEQAEGLGYLPSGPEGREAGGEEGAEGVGVAGGEGGSGSAEDVFQKAADGKVAYQPAGTVRRAVVPHGAVGAVGMSRAIASAEGDAAADALMRYSAPEEVMTFPASCGACGARAETRMFVTTIPYFKEVIVMASTCDICGYKNSEIKPGGAISEQGRKITLQVLTPRDLSRDLIKSDTASVHIPEVELELAAGTMGGLVTTVEGLVSQISESLKRVHGFNLGDSAPVSQKARWQHFEEQLQELLRVEKPWTLVLDDAVANSFIAPSVDDPDADTQLTKEDYKRTWEQDEELGLHDMDAPTGEVPQEEGAARAQTK